MYIRLFLFSLSGLLCLEQQLLANNVLITAPEANGQHLRFTLSWENSWNYTDSIAPNNHDAVWVFVKARSSVEAPWFHLPLQVTTHTTGGSPDLTSTVTADGKGAFISLSAPGAYEKLSQRMELATDTSLDLSTLDIRIFGIEMVYVPEGAFFAGDGASKYSFFDTRSGKPYLLEAENETLYTLGSLEENAPPAPVPASYPKGYGAFYCMKYELSQQQFTDFLNSLSVEQQASQLAVPPTSPAGTYALAPYDQSRNGIAIRYSALQNKPAVFACNANGNSQYEEEDDGQTRACNYLNWDNVAAYLDWAALRPLSELEYEKVCRGPEAPLKKEFAWGTQQVINGNTVVHNGTPEELVAETADPPYGLANHGEGQQADYLQGPLRSGFAATAATDRVAAGSSYYGIKDMSGNVWETCVATNSSGLLFTGKPGDGSLTSDGLANEESWPTKEGSGHRGGAWNSLISNELDYEFRDLAISDRYYAFLAVSRRNTTGGRGGRTK